MNRTFLALCGAALVSTALVQEGGDEAAKAVEQIAGQMQQFLASDVIYDARVVPYIQEAFDAKEIGGQEIIDSQFLPSLDWLDPDQGVEPARRTQEPAIRPVDLVGELVSAEASGAL